MPTVRKLPDPTVLRRLLTQGWTVMDIAGEFDVTRSAVSKALSRAGLTPTPLRVADIIPWKIEKQHQALSIMEHFRAIVKQRRGIALRAEEAEGLKNWLRLLNENEVVVNYHPDAPPNDASKKGGFYYVPREETDDWIVRQP